ATVELTAAQAVQFQEHGDTLAEFGLQVEPFGGRTVIIQAVPSSIPESAAVQLVTDFLDRMGEADAGRAPLERRQRTMAALAACKAAIKAKEALAPSEVDALIAELAACTNPGQCPHGR